ncbi:hypothetical protein D7X33_42790 [Butyricicoccus sp. 1XD8-22]|nr:hypothetical protein D7X33_42790 [Butyricicoccus sp. 1XD8-22]
MQLDLFTDEEILTGEDLERHKAKIYTAKSIYRSSGLRGRIKHYLSQQDKENAFKVFDEAFRTYGFGIPKGYTFGYYGGTGQIRYYMNDLEWEFEVDSKELFNILLKNL